MKVILLGGSGDMGRRAALALAESPEVSQLTVAGRNKAKAESFAAQLGPHVRAIALDAADRDALQETLRGYDVAAGAIGPFYLYEEGIAQAAIAAGTPYVSICDDHDATQAVLQLDGPARERGVTILTGAGWTPGLTNLMARKGCTMLDRAQAVHIAWATSVSDFQGFAVIPHFLHTLTGHVPTFTGGTWRAVRAGTGAETIPFPQPLGDVTVSHVGHPEPLTLPRFIPGLEEVTLKGGLAEGYITSLSLLFTRLGLTRTPAATQRLSHLLRPTIPLFQRFPKTAEPVSGAYVEVLGMKDGRKARATLACVGRMVDLTGIPLAMMAIQVGRGEIHHPGVIAPEAEAGPDPDKFFAALAEQGLAVDIQGPEYI